MDIRTKERTFGRDDAALVVLEGRLNAMSAPDVKRELKRLPGDDRVHIVVDMSGVSFVDSSGLAALVSGFKAAREAGGSLMLVGANQQAREVLEITKLNQVFKLYPDRDAAREALSER